MIFLKNFITVIGEIFGLKSIAAYRSGLEINTNVSRREAEEGLAEVLQGEYLSGLALFIDTIFLCSLFFTFVSCQTCPHKK